MTGNVKVAFAVRAFGDNFVLLPLVFFFSMFKVIKQECSKLV